jgi:adenine-specific DNA glycosylase
MELGATICRPKDPACARCPIRRGCGAFANGTQSRYPETRRAGKPVTEHLQVLIVRDRRGRYLMERRMEEGPLRGLWSFPIRDGCERRPARSDSLGTVRHAIMNRRLVLEVLTLRDRRSVPVTAARRFASPAEIRTLPRSSIVDKILSRVLEKASGRSVSTGS